MIYSVERRREGGGKEGGRKEGEREEERRERGGGKEGEGEEERRERGRKKGGREGGRKEGEREEESRRGGLLLSYHIVAPPMIIIFACSKMFVLDSLHSIEFKVTSGLHVYMCYTCSYYYIVHAAYVCPTFVEIYKPNIHF